jgi:hypothetical protein
MLRENIPAQELNGVAVADWMKQPSLKTAGER